MVACGSGIATSTIVAGKIEDVCREQGLEVQISTCTIPELYAVAQNADIIVTTSKYSRDVGVPVVNGVPLLTGIGKEKALEEILTLIKAK